MNNIDRGILEGLVAGKSPEFIALKLSIPLDWVLEFQDHYTPVERVVDDRLSGQTIDR